MKEKKGALAIDLSTMWIYLLAILIIALGLIIYFGRKTASISPFG